MYIIDRGNKFGIKEFLNFFYLLIKFSRKLDHLATDDVEQPQHLRVSEDLGEPLQSHLFTLRRFAYLVEDRRLLLAAAEQN